jgi:hypothetical protein
VLGEEVAQFPGECPEEERLITRSLI